MVGRSVFVAAVVSVVCLAGRAPAVPAEEALPAAAVDAADSGVPSSETQPPPAEGGIPEAAVEYQLLSSEGDATRLCEVFIQQVMAGEYDAAFAGIRTHFPISERRFAKLAEETRKQHGLAQLQFGRPLGQVYVGAAMVKDSLLRIRFVEKFEWDAMYWEFLFYQPERGWLLNGIGFDDDIQRLFQP
jgi:hypothetical protein